MRRSGSTAARRFRVIAPITAAAALAVGLAGSAFADTTDTTPGAATPAAASADDSIYPPSGFRKEGIYNTNGATITYGCAGGAWTVTGVKAKLSRERHPDGPRSATLVNNTWTSDDGSFVEAEELVSNRPANTGAGAIQWELRKATKTGGSGLFSKVAYVVRHGTEGGMPPSATCAEGDVATVPFWATYWLYNPIEG